jgi:hypothetical protein
MENVRFLEHRSEDKIAVVYIVCTHSPPGLAVRYLAYSPPVCLELGIQQLII